MYTHIALAHEMQVVASSNYLGQVNYRIFILG